MTIKHPNNKTASLSCRLDKNTYDQLVTDAAEKGISLNSLVNNITRNHITWERYADAIGFVPVTKRMLDKVFKQLDQKSIEKIAKDVGVPVIKELLFLTYGKMNFENLIQILEINASRFGVVNHVQSDDGVHTLNIHHGVSKNFSYYLACAHSYMADDLSIKLTITNIDKNMLCLEIEDSK